MVSKFNYNEVFCNNNQEDDLALFELSGGGESSGSGGGINVEKNNNNDEDIVVIDDDSDDNNNNVIYIDDDNNNARQPVSIIIIDDDDDVVDSNTRKTTLKCRDHTHHFKQLKSKNGNKIKKNVHKVNGCSGKKEPKKPKLRLTSAIVTDSRAAAIMGDNVPVDATKANANGKKRKNQSAYKEKRLKNKKEINAFTKENDKSVKISMNNCKGLHHRNEDVGCKEKISKNKNKNLPVSKSIERKLENQNKCDLNVVVDSNVIQDAKRGDDDLSSELYNCDKSEKQRRKKNKRRKKNNHNKSNQVFGSKNENNHHRRSHDVCKSQDVNIITGKQLKCCNDRSISIVRTNAVSPKFVLYHYYKKKPGNIQVSANNYLTWERIDARSSKQNYHDQKQKLFTSIFVCPITQEAFLAGVREHGERDCVRQKDRFADIFWFPSYVMAEHAAAARAWDCLLLREGGNLRDFRLCALEPYRLVQRSPWPSQIDIPTWVLHRLPPFEYQRFCSTRGKDSSSIDSPRLRNNAIDLTNDCYNGKINSIVLPCNKHDNENDANNHTSKPVALSKDKYYQKNGHRQADIMKHDDLKIDKVIRTKTAKKTTTAIYQADKKISANVIKVTDRNEINSISNAKVRDPKFHPNNYQLSKQQQEQERQSTEIDDFRRCQKEQWNMMRYVEGNHAHKKKVYDSTMKRIPVAISSSDYDAMEKQKTSRTEIYVSRVQESLINEPPDVGKSQVNEIDHARDSEEDEDLPLIALKRKREHFTSETNHLKMQSMTAKDNKRIRMEEKHVPSTCILQESLVNKLHNENKPREIVVIQDTDKNSPFVSLEKKKSEKNEGEQPQATTTTMMTPVTVTATTTAAACIQQPRQQHPQPQSLPTDFHKNDDDVEEACAHEAIVDTNTDGMTTTTKEEEENVTKTEKTMTKNVDDSTASKPRINPNSVNEGMVFPSSTKGVRMDEAKINSFLEDVYGFRSDTCKIDKNQQTYEIIDVDAVKCQESKDEEKHLRKKVGDKEMNNIIETAATNKKHQIEVVYGGEIDAITNKAVTEKSENIIKSDGIAAKLKVKDKKLCETLQNKDVDTIIGKIATKDEESITGSNGDNLGRLIDKYLTKSKDKDLNLCEKLQDKEIKVIFKKAPTIEEESTAKYNCDNHKPQSGGNVAKLKSIEFIDTSEETIPTRKKSLHKPRFKPQKSKKTQKLVHPIEQHEIVDCTQIHNAGPSGRRKRNRRNFVSIDSQFSSSPERRFVFHPSNGKVKPAAKKVHSNYFNGMTLEHAFLEQERLLRSAADRLKHQKTFRIYERMNKSKRSKIFTVFVPDVHLKYPDHWEYVDNYARLGLPRNTLKPIIKTAYRRLCLCYHPDRNIGKPDTKHKFQAVTEAYNNLINS